jgi:hypothetical protein
MSLTFRRTLFVIFILLFISIGIGTVYYSQGYRFDFSTLTIHKTGSVYIESFPKNVEIYIGNELYQDKSGIFQGGTLISNIIPKRYIVTIKKDGYYDYGKNIEVFPSQVVRLLNIRLIPKNVPPLLSANSIKGSAVIDISDNGKVLILDQKTNTYYSTDTSQIPAVQTNITQKIQLLTKQKINQLLFYPQTDTSFIASTAKGIYRADIGTKSFSVIQESSPTMMRSERNNLYLLMAAPAISKKIASTSTLMDTFDLVLNNKISEITLPLESETIKDFEIGNGAFAILLNNGTLWLYDYSGTPIVQIAHSAKQMEFSDDKTKLMFQDEDGKTFVYLMEDELASLDSRKGQTIRLSIINPQNTDRIWWFPDSFHLILQYPDKIVLAEVTLKEPNNHFLITPYQGNPYYDSTSKKLYILSNGTLTSYDIGAL